MRKRLVWITLLVIVSLLVGLKLHDGSGQKEIALETFSKNMVRYGATGKDVIELQGRLRFLGFFKGEVDGVFGYRTLKSVKWFQSEFGLDVDGRVGDKTKLKLWEATKNWKPTAADVPGGGKAPAAGGGAAGGTTPPKKGNVTQSNRLGLSEQDINIMANAVYGEARGEPYEGQVAVAAVILNRVNSPEFPNTANAVIFQPGAFTAVADGQIWLTPNDKAKQAVRDAINGWDPTGGCLYYFNPVTATSKWIWTRPQVKTIGKHIFCK